MRCAQPAVRRGQDTRPTLLPEKGLFLQAESSTLWGAALGVLHGFYGAVKERIRTAHASRNQQAGVRVAQAMHIQIQQQVVSFQNQLEMIGECLNLIKK